MSDTVPDTTPEQPAPRLDRTIPDDPTLARLAGDFGQAVFEAEADGDVAHVPPDDVPAFVEALCNAGYDVFVDLCGVDYLRRRPRYEVVINLLSYRKRRRMRIRVGVDGANPEIPSITSVFPGANFYERETFDLFGIVFTGHPDLTRILLPDDWEGYPLRKDYSVGSVPVQFKGAHKAS